MDAVDPGLVTAAERALTDTPGVRTLSGLRVRWVGHQLHAETNLGVDPTLSIVEAHAITVEAEHRLRHAVPRLTSATIHTDPADTDSHAALAHHLDPTVRDPEARRGRGGPGGSSRRPAVTVT